MNYVYIRAYGRTMEIPSRVISDLILIALEEKAPGNAIYRHDDGTWATIEDIKGIHRTTIERVAARLQRGENPRYPDQPPRQII